MSENIYDMNMILKLNEMCSIVEQIKTLMKEAIGEKDE